MHVRKPLVSFPAARHTQSVDADVCYRAVRARDARFDGLFFTAVRSTRIFCRPVCPAKTPLRRNVEFFSNAAAAQAAGYRPCLRCRPEVSPDAPVWAGTSATIQRALRLIDQGALDSGSAGELAERLGLTDRHLRRLFLEHLGIPPIVVAESRRTLFAKKLITETNLPFMEIAFASGFASLRRFNESIRKVYDRNPSQLRRFLPREPAAPGAIELKLHYRPPFNWDAFIGFIGPRAIPGIEEVTGGEYRRGGITVRHNPDANCVVSSIGPSSARNLRRITERIRFLFDLRANTQEIAAHLAKSPILKPMVHRNAGLRLPGCWDPFEMAVRAILGQQITVKGASTLAGRLAAQLGGIQADVLAEADLGQAGLTKARAESIRAFSRAVAGGSIRFDAGVSSADFIAQLCELPGIGPWTANYIAMRCLGDPDAFPASDQGLLRATGIASPRRLEEIAEAWRPWRSYAVMYLWESLRRKE